MILMNIKVMMKMMEHLLSLLLNYKFQK